eukprot:scaffold54086_cov27-Tisochrysis_lutea.AAC.5
MFDGTNEVLTTAKRHMGPCGGPGETRNLKGDPAIGLPVARTCEPEGRRGDETTESRTPTSWEWHRGPSC